MIHPVTLYGATCDNCGKSWFNDHYGWSAMSDETGMMEMLSDDGWHSGNGEEGEEGKHICPACDDEFDSKTK